MILLPNKYNRKNLSVLNFYVYYGISILLFILYNIHIISINYLINYRYVPMLYNASSWYMLGR